MFQTCFPPLPEFQGRQVVTLHNQRDFLFFRRHRYAFRSTEKVALQEIGPRFTLKLRWLKKGIPAVQTFGAPPKPLEFDAAEPSEEQGAPEKEDTVKDAEEQAEEAMETDEPTSDSPKPPQKTVPPTQDEYVWVWKVSAHTRRCSSLD